MYKIFTTVALCFFTVFNAQSKKKNFNDIIKSQDIAEIAAFLEVAHPQDPRRQILKKRLVQLKNEAWTKGKENHQPMAARKIEMEVDNSAPTSVAPVDNEIQEFNDLINISSQEHTNKTVKILNTLFDEDPTSKDAIILIENKSDCNIIVRINGGGKSYRLPVFAKKDNTIVIEKGNYSFTCLVCGVKYVSEKNVQKAQMIILNNPQLKK